MPLTNFLGAVSVGMVDNEVLTDMCFLEDSAAQVDMNVVMDSHDNFIEIQSSAEGKTFSRQEFDILLDNSAVAIREIMDIQKKNLMEKK
jgi:ribonuclease PH